MFLIFFFSLFLQLIGNIGTVDFNGTVCDPEMLKKYLLFPREVDIEQISQSLCGINDTLISNITNDLVRMLDIPNIIRLVCIQNQSPSHCLFSSPEHEVLMVSFCDRSMSVVGRPSCVVRRPQFL